MKKSLLCAVLACTVFVNAAHADPVVFNWTGTAKVALAQYGIGVGDAYSGTVSIDPTGAGMMGNPAWGAIQWVGSPMFVTVKAGTLDETIAINTSIENDYYGSIDGYQFYNPNSTLGYFNLQLQDPSGKAVNDFALPTTLDYTAFSTRHLIIHGQSVASLTSFGAAQAETDVPEPATLGLTALGLAAVGLARRRKQRA